MLCGDRVDDLQKCEFQKISVMCVNRADIVNMHHCSEVCIGHQVSAGCNPGCNFSETGEKILIFHYDSTTRHFCQSHNIIDCLLRTHGIIEHPGVGRQSNVTHDCRPGQAQDLGIIGTVAQKVGRCRVERRGPI